MHITVIGAGGGCRLLIKALERENSDVDLWIPRTEEKDPWRSYRYEVYDDVREILRADFKDTDAFVFFDPSPSAAILASELSAWKVPIHFVCYDANLARLLEKNPERFGINYVYDYGKILAERVRRFFFVEKGMQTEVFHHFGLALLKLGIGEDPVFVGRRIRDIGPLEELVVVTVRRGETIIVPDGNTVLEENDVLRMTGDIDAIRRFRRRYARARFLGSGNKNKRFIVYGDGEEARRVEEILSREGDVIAFNERRRRPYGARYDIFRPVVELFEAVEPDTVDGFVAISERDADNFLAATAAGDEGIRQIALCLKDERLIRIVDVAHNSGIFSGELLISQRIKHRLFGPPDISLRLFPGSLDIYEIVLKDDVEAVGKTIEALDLSKSFLIGGIERGGRSVLAKGKTVLEAGDRLLLFLLPESAPDLEKFVRRKPASFLTELFSF